MADVLRGAVNHIGSACGAVRLSREACHLAAPNSRATCRATRCPFMGGVVAHSRRIG